MHKSTTVFSHRIVNSGIIALLAIVAILSCGSHARKESSRPAKVLTTESLLQINREVRFTYFYYPDTVLSGLMLNWQPDSVLIQPRNRDLPLAIPTKNLVRIETVVGNRSMEGLAIGSLIAAGYFVAVKGYSLSGVTFLEGLAKLLVPPAIIVTAIGIGAAKEKRDTYVIPPGFQFDFEDAKKRSPK